MSKLVDWSKIYPSENTVTYKVKEENNKETFKLKYTFEDIEDALDKKGIELPSISQMIALVLLANMEDLQKLSY